MVDKVGARVTAHVFGAAALPDLISAGIDCIEHGTGLTTDLIGQLATRRTALVPTLINIANFPSFADAGEAKFPAYAAQMRRLHAGVTDMVASAYEAGVPIYAGTDAGGTLGHGLIALEVAALAATGMTPTDALAAGSWAARSWLGLARNRGGRSCRPWSPTTPTRDATSPCSADRRGSYYAARSSPDAARTQDARTTRSGPPDGFRDGRQPTMGRSSGSS